MGHNAVSLRPGFSASVHLKKPAPRIDNTCAGEEPGCVKSSCGLHEVHL